MTDKIRLDILLVESGLVPSREKARGFIMAGEVLVNGIMIDKAGTLVKADAEITLKSRSRFVSRGGEKLDAAFEAFPISVDGKVCADVGASTGGFTDCMLQRGAAKIYAIDVGYGQIALPLRQDPRVVLYERTNARHLETLPEQVSFVSIDASFISLTLLLPTIRGWLQPSHEIVPLIKPQFEAGKGDVGKGGVVRDPKIHRRVLFDVCEFAQDIGFHVNGLIISPLKGPAGNVEFLAWFSSTPIENAKSLDQLVETVVQFH